MPDPDPLADVAADALERIRSEFEAFGASCADFSRLLAAAERALALAEQWHRGRGNDYSATAQCSRELGKALRAELLAEEETDEPPH
jgi:hypothetical protein